MTTRIGWYVHHHGSGHLTRLLAIAPHLVRHSRDHAGDHLGDVEIDCYSSLPRPAGLPAGCTWTELPRDDEPAPRLPADDPTVGGLLHWAPLGHTGHRSRLATLGGALDTRDVDVFVVDVSVEVALLVRLLGARVVLVTQPGERVDEPHRLAFAAAERIIAPWPAEIATPPHLAAWDGRVEFVGGISRFAGRSSAVTEPGDDVVLLGGGGGSSVAGSDIAAAEAATGRRWRVLGAGGAAWRDDPWADLTSASVVVSWCGQNAVADLAAAGCSAIVIPQDRPFGEQRATAAALARAGLAVALDEWPDADAWPSLIAHALDLDPDWQRWRVDGAAERAAEAIAQTARRAQTARAGQ